MDDYTRYGIYFTAVPGSDYAAKGAAWLGWDIDRGEEVAHPELPRLPLPLSEITQTPRKYGFHGTLKPPFRLAPGQTVAALKTAMTRFGETQKAPLLTALAPARLGPFLALIPSERDDDLHALAAACITEFDAFRAPATDAELAKRRKGGLTPAQDAFLTEWGYPYIFSEFRFHMTLSGRLNDAQGEAVLSAAKAHFADVTLSPFAIDAVTLCGERPDGRFETIERYALTG